MIPPAKAKVMSFTTAPIRIGYCLSLTGPLAGNSQSARLAHEIWRSETNDAGGLLGRPVEFVCYDDEGDASRVTSLYERLLDEDGVDLVIGGYGTNTILPVMPLVIERGRYFVGLMGLGVNNEHSYQNYFAMIPTGPDPSAALTEGFFEVAAQQTPRPITVALLSADAIFSKNPILGAKANAERHGFEVVYEAEYSLETTDFVPVLDAVAASNCDLLFLCSYIQDSIDLIRAIRKHSFRPKMVGAGMIGPQNTSVKTTLGPLLNGLVNYEYWVPVSTMGFPGVAALLDIYRERARVEGVDLLGHYMAPLAYAQMQVVTKAILSTGGLDDQALSNFTRTAVFDTVMGEVSFGKNGEWETPRVVQVQFQGIDSHDADQFKDGSKQIAVSPSGLASGHLIFPYASAL
jgi:branched-chain amino acid transport system substrate-binding protein